MAFDVNQQILSDITVFMKYAKYIPEKQRRETWTELVDRNKEMHIKRFPTLKDEIEDAYKLVYEKKILPSMRSLQFAGKSIEIGNQRIYNCCYLPLDHYKAFSETMFLLLSGCGVGYSVQFHHVEQLEPIQKPTKGQRYVVEDSIAGWADAVKMLMKSYFTGKFKPRFDFSDIRPKGSLLVTSGGKAPGPEPLKVCLAQIEAILENKQNGDKLSPLECHDIQCHLADAVLSGGIRRAAMIALFSIDDEDMLTCKYGNWWELNPQRARSNNSATILRNRIQKDEFLELWKKIELSNSGEPGISFTNDVEYSWNPCVVGDTKVNVISVLPESYGDPNKNRTGSLISIKELVQRFEAGEKLFVQSFDLDANRVRYKLVTDAALTRKNATLIQIKYNSKILKCTPDHKIYTHRGWIAAKDLVGTDVLCEIITEDIELGNNVNYLQIDELAECEDVYDITVDETHCFFANNLLIRNCHEISLRKNTFCNLVEINGSSIESQEDFINRCKSAAFISTLQASYTDFYYLRPIWKHNTEKDALVGVGITGIASNAIQPSWIKKGSKAVKEENERVAKLIGINKAARTTTVKPSGTTSVVLGTSSGIHAWHNDYYIRRIRVNKNESIYQYLKQNHPNLIEDEYFKPKDTAVISIPQKAPEGSVLRTESVLDLLERVKLYNMEWIRPGHNRGPNPNNVSATVSIKPDEWGLVGEWMWANKDYYSGISVLPYDGGTYVQAPFENITKEQYEEMSQNLHGIDLTKIIELQDVTDLSGEVACANGYCEI